MSIYIPGMEMPKGNGELRLIIHSNGQVIISHKTHYEEAEAFPVPEHGRLIDADATKVSIAYAEETGDWSVPQMRTVLEIIDAAPTIIPADRERET